MSDEDQFDGYPSTENLETIANWELKTWDDYRGLAKYICDCWHWGEPWGRLRGNTLTLSTGGWSGNEEMMVAVRRNKMFMMACWESERRGGHYVFKLPPRKTFKK